MQLATDGGCVHTIRAVGTRLARRGPRGAWSRPDPTSRHGSQREGFATAVAGPSAMEGAMTAMADPAVIGAPDGESWHFGAAMFGGVIASAKLDVLRRLADDYRPDLSCTRPWMWPPRCSPPNGPAVGHLRVRPGARSSADHRTAPSGSLRCGGKQASIPTGTPASIAAGTSIRARQACSSTSGQPRASPNRLRPEVPGDPRRGTARVGRLAQPTAPSCTCRSARSRSSTSPTSS